jgi:hypothetical protein
VGLPVNLQGSPDRTKIVRGPSFQSRNNIVGSDDTMAMLIEPFDILIGTNPGRLFISARDLLDPADPGKEAWEFDGPERYARRFPVSVTTEDREALSAIGVFDMHGYFWDRRRYLERRIAELRARADKDEDKGEAEIQRALSRIHQIDFWGVRMFNKLGFKTSWKHGLNANRVVFPDSSELLDILGGYVDKDGPWTVSYWFGGWDGDLLVGYVRGSLSFPFLVVKRDAAPEGTEAGTEAERRSREEAEAKAKARAEAEAQGAEADPSARPAT